MKIKIVKVGGVFNYNAEYQNMVIWGWHFDGSDATESYTVDELYQIYAQQSFWKRFILYLKYKLQLKN